MHSTAFLGGQHAQQVRGVVRLRLQVLAQLRADTTEQFPIGARMQVKLPARTCAYHL